MKSCYVGERLWSCMLWLLVATSEGWSTAIWSPSQFLCFGQVFSAIPNKTPQTTVMSCTRSFHKQNLSCSRSQSLGLNEKRKSIASNLYKLTSRRLIRKWPKSTSKRPHLQPLTKRLPTQVSRGGLNLYIMQGVSPSKNQVMDPWMSCECWGLWLGAGRWKWRRMVSSEGGAVVEQSLVSQLGGGGFDILLIQESSNGRTHWTVLERTPRKNVSI